MILHQHINKRDLRQKIRSGEILVAGNLNLKIYGLLSCLSGKRMKKMNRVFFADEQEAIANGFRPCGHCMTHRYREWKMNI
jgi:methylphosphotriester-DNA--protein-cysteine methyltransferase